MGKIRVLLCALATCLLVLLPSGQTAFAAGPPSPRAVAPVPQQVAPSPPQTPPPPPSVPSLKTTKPATKSVGPDADIEKGIRARFSKSKIGADGFTVRVESGTAIIDGKTGIIQHKGTATRLAKLAGAKRVDNRIEISEEARQKAAAHLASGKKVHVQPGKTN